MSSKCSSSENERPMKKSKCISPVDVTDAEAFLRFVNASRSPYHAVKELRDRFTAAGFEYLSEMEDWTAKIQPNKKYFFTRNESTLFAFAVGGQYQPGNGFSMVAAHTDSPCLRVKPVSKKKKGGFFNVGVECYGGGLWHTWFDRDLTVAGKVLLKDGDQFRTQLVEIRRPIMRIPTLAIHLQRTVNEKGFLFNKETHLEPVLCTAVKAALAPPPSGQEGEDKAASDNSMDGKHHSVLLDLLSEELGVEASKIMDFELCLADSVDATIGGARNEFVFSPRLDNLCMSFCSSEALIRSLPTLKSDANIRVVACYDHEEIGSSSMQGAASSMTLQALTRIAGQDNVPAAMRRSLLVSSDMAHALHPNYPEKHEAGHRPEMHKGLVIKTNSNQRYATSCLSSFALRQIAHEEGIPIQEFVVRNDFGCGSTIGPIVATLCGMRTVDVGAPQLSMHSIREMCAVDDFSHSINLFSAFFTRFAAMDARLSTSD